MSRGTRQRFSMYIQSDIYAAYRDGDIFTLLKTQDPIWHEIIRFEDICQLGNISLVRRHKSLARPNIARGLRGACKSGNLDLVKTLMCELGNELLEISCKYIHLHILQYLAEQIPICDIKRIFNKACRYSQHSIIEYILKHWHVNLYDGLLGICRSGNIQLFNEATSGMTCYMDYQHQSLMYNAGIGGNMDIIEQISSKTGGYPEDLLMGACAGGHIDIINYAIGLGAKNFNGPMSIMKYASDIPTVKYLISVGADPNTLLFSAKDPELIKYAVSLGHPKNTYFETACHSGNIPLIQYLLDEVTYFDWGFELACSAGHLYVVKMLIKYVKSVDTGLRIALRDNQYNIVEYLESLAGEKNNDMLI